MSAGNRGRMSCDDEEDYIEWADIGRTFVVGAAFGAGVWILAWALVWWMA